MSLTLALLPGAAAIGRVFVSREGAVQETLAEHRALAGGVPGLAQGVAVFREAFGGGRG